MLTQETPSKNNKRLFAEHQLIDHMFLSVK